MTVRDFKNLFERLLGNTRCSEEQVKLWEKLNRIGGEYLLKGGDPSDTPDIDKEVTLTNEQIAELTIELYACL